MKTTYLLFLTMFAMLFTFPSCDDDEVIEDDFPYDYIEGGTQFSIGNTMRFYYVDGDGKSLIDPEDATTYPVTYNNDEKLPETAIIPGDFKSHVQDDGFTAGFYNGNVNSILYDGEEKLYYMMTSAYGHMKQPNYIFYIGFGNEFDKMDMTYKYTDKNVIGGKYGAKMITWKFNGTPVYSAETDYNLFDIKVFVKKDAGKTTVWVKK